MPLIQRLRRSVSLVLLITLAPPAFAEKARSADAFVESVGMNVHLHGGNTPYGDFPRVQRALQDLGVRHVRDGLIDTTWQEYYDRHNQLGRAGIKGIFITSPDQSTALLLDYPRRMKDSFEAYEAPNEYDQSDDEHWTATLTRFLARLKQTVKSNSNPSHFPVIGPSMIHAKSFIQARGVCLFDYANLHNYFAGRNPGTLGWGANGYGSLSWNLSNVTTACPGKPVITTETGYQTAVALGQGVPEEVAAKYVPRVFLEQWLHGIDRTYLYELIDLPAGSPAPDSSFGLMRSDYSSKPAYSALKSLLHLLADRGPSFVGQDLEFQLTGDLSDVHHLLLQKRNGIFYLILWLEKSSYDVDRKKAITVPIRSLSIQNNSEVRMAGVRFDRFGSLQTATPTTGAHHDIEVSDSVTILEIDSRPLASTRRWSPSNRETDSYKVVAFPVFTAPSNHLGPSAAICH